MTAKPGKRRKHNLKVDLTPMVDLGFLLVSFFVFTATMLEPKVLDLIIPPEGPPGKTAMSGAVTLIADSNQVCYYFGDTPTDPSAIAQVRYRDIEELRMELLSLKRRLIQQNGNDDKLMVFIKPGEKSQIGHLVDLLDEMSICDIKRYMIGELNTNERQLLSLQ